MHSNWWCTIYLVPRSGPHTKDAKSSTDCHWSSWKSCLHQKVWEWWLDEAVLLLQICSCTSENITISKIQSTESYQDWLLSCLQSREESAVWRLGVVLLLHLHRTSLPGGAGVILFIKCFGRLLPGGGGGDCILVLRVRPVQPVGRHGAAAGFRPRLVLGRSDFQS